MRLRIPIVALCLAFAAPALGAELLFKERFLAHLVKRVPVLLESYDPPTGRFGSGIWIVTDQNVMLPLAVAWSHKHPANPYHHDPKLLDVLMKAGDALIDDMDANGQWEFRKKDGSTWGKISMPWTYSRWIRTYDIIKDAMPPDRRERWLKAFDRGFGHIAKTQLGHVHNIPAHHAMALYVAGKTMDRADWREKASAFLHKVAEVQFDGGYWSEDAGPVVAYNFVYSDALGTYYALSGDKAVLPAIEKAIRFHLNFTYPSGQEVETIDQRNPYRVSLVPGNPAFTLTPVGRAFLKQQWSLPEGDVLSDDATALFLLHGREGTVDEAATRPSSDMLVLSEGGAERAAVIRKGPWFVCLSAYTADIPDSRWHQDRQNFVSIWHEETGLILGGGNTKLQPAWSNFTVGDTSLLRHTPGDESPKFQPKGELYHVPGAATLVREPQPGLDLTYGPETCRIRLDIQSERTLVMLLETTAASDKPVAAHLTLLPRMNETLTPGAGRATKLTDSPLEYAPADLAGSLALAGYRLTFPKTSSLHWPALPHNPYRKDGRSEPPEGRLEIRVPFTQADRAHRIIIEVPS